MFSIKPMFVSLAVGATLLVGGVGCHNDHHDHDDDRARPAGWRYDGRYDDRDHHDFDRDHRDWDRDHDRDRDRDHDHRDWDRDRDRRTGDRDWRD